MKVLVINGHPETQTYCAALADAYAEGAAQSRADVRRLDVGAIRFQPNYVNGFQKQNELEPELAEAQELIRWADHLVFVYPTWWGTMPALLKGFIDRVFLPGFAFKYRNNSQLWDKLLTGKSARMIVTMDTPPWYNRWIYRHAGHRVMRDNILKFCGISPVRITEIGPVRPSTAEKREKWLADVRNLGMNRG
ncbi:NAD(P)H-dependent oxidoreductase [Paenibacillus methanolicus]|uniref:Putative NADPH-quinone reductase n=1 Tax=Paenibacillus methanolicus TaxID=582686 RepID=A0A5S5C7S6_9BACL|nr:NAD(P)H-dependent oxidoreductase [Paenibacillus methanolicus]TYP74043.1 putative NADPH-quinone reductase [Paenibacillus methanolicus]